MGGGGTSGGVDFPSHVKDWHNDLMGGNPSSGGSLDTVAVAMDTAVSNNPYSSVTAATTGHLEDTVDQWAMDVQAAIQDLDDREAWKDRLGDAVAEIITSDVLEEIDASSLLSSSESDSTSEINTAATEAKNAVQSAVIDPVIDEFEQKVNSRLDERKRTVSALYADVNAVHSSAFLISQALLERDAQREVNERDAEIRLETYQEAFQAHIETFVRSLEARLRAEVKNKDNDDRLVGESIQQMLQTSRTDEQLRIEERRAFQQAAASDFEARQQAEEYELSVDEKAELWQLRIHETGSNILAAPSGMAARVPPKKSDTSKAVGGALAGAGSGASAGATIGAAGGPIGAGAGALIGAGLGAASGFL